MRLVEILEWKKRAGSYKYELVSTGEIGKFIQYGVDYQEFETGPGNYTTAIVEMPDGTVRNLPVNQIRFTEPQRKEEEDSDIL